MLLQELLKSKGKFQFAQKRLLKSIFNPKNEKTLYAKNDGYNQSIMHFLINFHDQI